MGEEERGERVLGATRERRGYQVRCARRNQEMKDPGEKGVQATERGTVPIEKVRMRVDQTSKV